MLNAKALCSADSAFLFFLNTTSLQIFPGLSFWKLCPRSKIWNVALLIFQSHWVAEWQMAADSFIVFQRKPDVRQIEVDTLHVKDIRLLLFWGWKSFGRAIDTGGCAGKIPLGNTFKQTWTSAMIWLKAAAEPPSWLTESTSHLMKTSWKEPFKHVRIVCILRVILFHWLYQPRKVYFCILFWHGCIELHQQWKCHSFAIVGVSSMSFTLQLSAKTDPQ